MLKVNEKKSLISVIMIFLNAEKFIQESIGSVISQSYDCWELLLVDDGSTDSSTEIAKSFAQQYPDKIVYLEHEGHQNRGMSATRNLGIRNAGGDYIAILDSDDVWLPHKLEEQVAILDAHPHVAMIYGRTQFWFSWAESQSDSEDFLSGIGFNSSRLVRPPMMLTRFFKSCPYPCSVLVRRDTALKLGGFEEEFKGMYEDQAFFSKIFAHETVFVSDNCWDKYRQHSQSCCAMAIKAGEFHPEEPNLATYNFLKWLKNYLKREGIKNLRVWLVLNMMLLPYNHPFWYKLYHHVNQLIKEFKYNLPKSIGKFYDNKLPKAANLSIKKSE